jgi:flavin reductase (DIM6/NTAB) family NADH-FMN oxidoreductase RutF
LENDEQIRKAWGNFPSGVTVVTTNTEDGQVYGMTAIRVIACADNPPMVLFLLGRQRQTYDNLARSERFGLSILAGNQVSWADYCARAPEQRDWQTPGDYRFTDTGTAIIDGALAFMDCRVVAVHEVGTQTMMMVGEVESLEVQEGMPLLFHRGEYLDVSGDDEAPT